MPKITLREIAFHTLHYHLVQLSIAYIRQIMPIVLSLAFQWSSIFIFSQYCGMELVLTTIGVVNVTSCYCLFQEEGMKVGDFVVQVSSVDTKWAHHDDVVKLVRQAGSSLTLKVVTPMGPSFLDQRVSPPASIPSTPSTPTRMQSPNGSMVSSKSGKSGKRLSASWIFARKNSNKDNGLERTVPTNSEVMLR